MNCQFRRGVCFLLALFLAGRALAAELYVSPTGNDANPGTQSQPLATLRGARDAIRSIKQRAGLPPDGINVNLAPGTYRLTQTFELNDADSGQETARITYRAAAAHDVFIIGGIDIPPASVTPVTDPAILDRLPPASRGKVVQVNLKALGVTDFGPIGPRGYDRPITPAPLEVFINDQPLTLARWPNAGEAPIPIGQVLDKGSVPRNGDFSNRGATFTYDTDRPARWQSASDIWISGLFNNGYADDMLAVAKIDIDKKTITTAGPHMYGFSTGKPWNTWFASNLLEEIDQPGEFYADSHTGILYFLPPSPLENAHIQISTLNGPMVAMESASFITFERLTFECSRGIGIYIERGRSNLIAGCTLRNLGLMAVCIGQGVTPDPQGRHEYTGQPVSRTVGSLETHMYANTAFNRQAGVDQRVQSCDIYNTGAGGISLGGGDRKTLTPAANAVVNCDIHNFNRWYRSYCAGVNIDGVGNIVQHCHIYDCPSSAIYLHGNDHIIEYNQVDHALIDANDMGAFYMGRNPSEQGNILRYNFFHDCGNSHGATYVFHLDDGTCGTKIIGNIVDASDHICDVNGGYDNQFINNIFIDNRNSAPAHAGIRAGYDAKKWATFIHTPLQQSRLHGDVDITGPLYSSRYPDLATLEQAQPPTPRRNQVWQNVAVRSGSLTNPRPNENPDGNDMRDNLQTNDDPGFVDASHLNFALRPDSVVYQKIPGFQPIPFDQIGLQPDEYRALPSAKK